MLSTLGFRGESADANDFSDGDEHKMGEADRRTEVPRVAANVCSVMLSTF